MDAATNVLHDLNEMPEHDRSKWDAIIHDFCEMKYVDPTETKDKQLQRYHRYRKMAQTCCAQGRPSPTYDVEVTFEGRARLKDNSAPGGDNLATEMIKALPVTAVYNIH